MAILRAIALFVVSTVVSAAAATTLRAEDRAESPRSPQVRALLLNGGGSAATNYLSHLHHLQDMAQALRDRGIAPDRIDVFSADGDDPKADLAVRGSATPDFWLIEKTALGVVLDHNETTNTIWEGVKLHPASSGELRRWFAKAGRELRPGDTLFVFVTDHGSRNTEDPDNGFISLWSESLSVLEFRALLGHLRPGVRVVNVMSQCYSGAFADAMSPFYSPIPSGDVCGFYSTTRDRQAFGCYPEGRDRDRVGHAFHFIDSMERHPSLDDAHDEVLVGDTSPDVPLRTSDVCLEGILERESVRSGLKPDALVDQQLALAFKTPERFEREIRLLDRIGDVYATFSPRTLGELNPHIEELQTLSSELDTYEARWQLALDDLRKDNLQQFLDATPEWKDKIAPNKINALTLDQRKATLDSVLPVLKTFTVGREDVWKRLQELRRTHADASVAKYRLDIRRAALARMHTLLVRVAALRFLEVNGDDASKRAFARLVACESTPVGALDAERQKAAGEEVVEKLPPYDADVEIVRRVLPSWLGITFHPVTDAERTRLSVARGAVVVEQVYPDSPALNAGIRPGDAVLGPPGARFAEPTQIREWTMNSPRDKALPLEVSREGETLQMQVSLAAYPAKIPALPAPPKAGDVAPPLDHLKTVRAAAGEEALATGKRHLVFFWETWCGPCKSSVPELLEWSAKTGVPVVAVSDEDPETIRKFLDDRTAPFPHHVVTDDTRAAHLSYGVSGTPTFVLVGEDGKIEWRQVGYATTTGLGIPGWTSTGRGK